MDKEPLLSSNGTSEYEEDGSYSPPSYSSVMEGKAASSPVPPFESRLRKRLTSEHLKKSYSLKSLFTVKPIQAFLESRETRTEGSSLAEKLGVIDLLGYGVGCTVGAGIYSLIGVGAGIAGITNPACMCMCTYTCEHLCAYICISCGCPLCSLDVCMHIF